MIVCMALPCELITLTVSLSEQVFWEGGGNCSHNCENLCIMNSIPNV